MKHATFVIAATLTMLASAAFPGRGATPPSTPLTPQAGPPKGSASALPMDGVTFRRATNKPDGPILAANFTRPPTDADIHQLVGQVRLEVVTAKDGSQLTDAGFGLLKNFPDLGTLSLNSSKITEAGIANLDALTKIITISLPHGSGIDDAAVGHLKHFTRLHNLNLQDTKITDAGAASLAGLTQIEILDLSRTALSDAGMEALKDMKKMRSLQLDHTQITSAGVKFLKDMTGMQNLHLDYNSGVDDEGLAALEGMTHLQKLWLIETATTDAGLVHLKGMTELQSLYLQGTQVTDAGMEQLKGLTKLRQLFVNHSHVSDRGVAMIHEALPQCEIQLTGLENVRGGPPKTAGTPNASDDLP